MACTDTFYNEILHTTPTWPKRLDAYTLVSPFEHTVMAVYVFYPACDFCATYYSTGTTESKTKANNHILSWNTHAHAFNISPALHRVAVVLTVQRAVFYQYVL